MANFCTGTARLAIDVSWADRVIEICKARAPEHGTAESILERKTDEILRLPVENGAA